jgi:Zn-dependent M28 family amino/carboxypeptidase
VLGASVFGHDIYRFSTQDNAGTAMVVELARALAGREDELGMTVEFVAFGAEEVGDRFDHPMKTVPKQGPHSDHWPFVRWGVPSYHVTSDTGPDRGWGHTHADTLDKLDARTFREQAILLTELAVELTGDEFAVSHKEPGDIAAALEAEGEAAGMKVTGEWPY